MMIWMRQMMAVMRSLPSNTQAYAYSSTSRRAKNAQLG